MQEPDPDCRDASVWWDWCQYLTEEQKGEYPETNVEDILHDITQSMMWQITSRDTVRELSRIGDVALPPGF